MSLFQVDGKTCTRCGVCAASCPTGIIDFQAAGEVPVPSAEAAEQCIGCGHCVAVCPPGALSHMGMSPKDCLDVTKDARFTPEQTEQFLRGRRSIRSYRKEPVPRELLARLIEIASHAPTAKNSQTVLWRVVHDSAEVQRIAGLVIDWMRHTMQVAPEQARAAKIDRVVETWDRGVDRVCRNAPHLIVTHAAKDDPFAPVSCATALSYLELAAPPLGLGSCWAGYFTAAAKVWAPLQLALGLPEGNVCYGGVLVGYPRYSYPRLPARNKPRIIW